MTSGNIDSLCTLSATPNALPRRYAHATVGGSSHSLTSDQDLSA